MDGEPLIFDVTGGIILMCQVGRVTGTDGLHVQ